MTFNIVFAGTPDFAAIALEALLHSPHIVQAVYTQPDRPAGRGQQLTAGPVKQLAAQQGLPVYQPASLKDPIEHDKLTHFQPDLMVVVAYGLILPAAILAVPRYGCINIHASLLPRWRGAAPIQRSLLAGDEKTGITIMKMEAGLDTGPILLQTECTIREDDSAKTLHDRLATMGAQGLLTTLASFLEIKPREQDNNLATYAKKVTKEEAEIDWHIPANEIVRKVRAFYAWPVAFTYQGQQLIRIWEAECLDMESHGHQPGEILQASSVGIDVATGEKVVRLLKMQLPGGKVLAVSDLLNGHAELFTKNTRLEKDAG